MSRLAWLPQSVVKYQRKKYVKVRITLFPWPPLHHHQRHTNEQNFYWPTNGKAFNTCVNTAHIAADFTQIAWRRRFWIFTEEFQGFANVLIVFADYRYCSAIHLIKAHWRGGCRCMYFLGVYSFPLFFCEGQNVYYLWRNLYVSLWLSGSATLTLIFYVPHYARVCIIRE